MTHPPTRGAIRTASRPTALAVLTLLAVLLAALTVASPARADDATGATPPGKAWIRAGHFVPGFGAARVDLRPATGQGLSVVMSPDANYGDVTSYQKIEPGTYVVDIRSSEAATSSTPLLSRSFTVSAGSASTIAVLGAPTAPRLAILSDDLTPPATDTARVRVLSASANATTLGVKAQGGPQITSGAVLGQTTAYTSVPQGTWTLDLSGAQGAASTQTVTLAGGRVYTAVALDTEPTGVRLELVTDAAGATTTPVGAAATGLGGTAAGTTPADAGTTLGGPLGLGGLVALALLALATVRYGASRRARRVVPVVAGSRHDLRTRR